MDALVCRTCGKEHPLDSRIWQCPCGGLLDIRFTARFPRGRITNRKPNMWRYREAIPIQDDSSIVSFDEGFTPMLDLDIGGRKVLFKSEHLHPTGSFKDRGASVLISKARELGITHVIEDSSGNAGAAIAAYCARAGIVSDIYVPASTSPQKVAQIRAYGAHLKTIKGSREDIADAALKAATGKYYASHSYNPFFFQGTKTWAYEVWEQLDFKAPDMVVLPVGNGTLLLGAYLGFKDLLDAGESKAIPKIIGIQTQNCAPLYDAFRSGKSEPTVSKVKAKDTMAEGIAIASPVRGTQILKAVCDTDGIIIAVSEKEIASALKWGFKQGLFIEPTAAATVAGVSKFVKGCKPEHIIVSAFTGHGLKASDKIAKIISPK